MRSQQTFLSRKIGASRVRVVKTYDAGFAREAFQEMDETALAHLAKTMAAEDLFDPEDAPQSPSEYADFLWGEVAESSRERDQISSFFVVTRASGDGRSLLYVSGDWPSAESYAKELAANVTA